MPRSVNQFQWSSLSIQAGRDQEVDVSQYNAVCEFNAVAIDRIGNAVGAFAGKVAEL